MAVLVEGVQYGLSSHGYSSENKSLIFVKLTDSALRSIEDYLKNKCKSNQHPTIQFLGNEGHLSFPSENEESGSSFRFSLSSAAEMGGPQGSFECVQQCGARSLESLGPLLHKMSIHAKDDVYETTRQRMAVAEEESKKNCTRVIKSSGPDIGRKVKVRKQPGSVVVPPRRERDSPPPFGRNSSSSSSLHPPGPLHQGGSVPTLHSSRNAASSPSLAPPHPNAGRSSGSAISPLPRSANASPSAPSSTSSVSRDRHSTSGEGNPELARRPLRERLIHLLAIKPYKKPELLGRLHKEGLKEKDKKLVMLVLRAIALMKDNVYHLARHVWNDVQDDWPFYSDQERQILKRRKPQNLTPPGSDSSMGSGHSPPSSSSQPGDSPTSGSGLAGLKGSSQPSTSQKRPTSTTVDSIFDDGGSDPAALNKKPRISHYKKPDSSQQQQQPQQPPVVAAKTSSSSNSSVSLAPSSKNAPRTSPQPAQAAPPPPPTPTPSQAALPTRGSRDVDSNGYFNTRRPAAATTTTVVSTRVTSSTDGPETPNSSPDSFMETMESETAIGGSLDCPEYVQQYQRIASDEQRSRYKAEFNAQYREYRSLHSTVDKVSKRFAQLEESLKQESKGSPAWERIKKQIVQEYKALRDTKYQEAKRRFQYLHEKLAHIKRLVSEWDMAHAQQTCRS